MKSGDIATPVNAEAPRLEAEVKRLEEAYARAISQVDKEQIARDKEAVKAALEEVVEATKMPMSAPIKKSVKKTTSTKKKKKTKNK